MIEDIIQIAKEAGEIIRSSYRQDFGIEFKTNHTNLVTEVDKKSEKLIIDFINKKYPLHGILAEESGGNFKNKEYVWVIDPLDGTTNFAHGLPIFSVSIGVLRNNEIIAGVVYDVMRNALYSAEQGSGSFCGTRKLSVSNNDLLAHSLLVTGFPYDIADNPDKAIELFTHFLKTSRAVRRLGSAAIDICYVADGIFDGFWEVNLHPWDICAGKLILEEAGGLFTDFRGNRRDIFNKKTLATNGRIHGEMMSNIENILS